MINMIKDKVSENLIIATIPVIGYIVALFYQFGYANYFEFPLDLIEIDLEMTLTSSLWVAVYICVIAVIFNYYSLFTHHNGILSKIAESVLHFSILPLLIMFATAFDKNMFYIFMGSMLIGLLFATVPPLFSMKDKGYRQALIDLSNKTNDSNDKKTTNHSNLDGYISKFALTLIFLGICHGAGRYNAEQKEDFYSFNYNKQSYVLISSYGEHIIASKLESKDNKITKEFSIFYPSKQFITGMKKIKISKNNKPREDS